MMWCFGAGKDAGKVRFRALWCNGLRPGGERALYSARGPVNLTARKE